MVSNNSMFSFSNLETDYLTMIHDIPLLSSNQLLALFSEYKSTLNEDILKQIVEHNLRLVPGIAKLYLNKCNHLKFMDLIQEGNYGLMKAARSFDPNYGTAFSTFATSYIHGYIKNAIAMQERLIKEDSRFVSQLMRYQKLKRKYQNCGEEEPSDEELCSILGVSFDTLRLFEEVNVRKITSLDAKLKEDADDCLLDVISSAEDVSTEMVDNYMDQEIMVLCKWLLKSVSYFVLYYQYFSKKVILLSDLGNLMGSRRQNASQYLKKAIQQLKPYFTSSSLYSETLQAIKTREGKNYSFLSLKPISPQDITKYLYAYPFLMPIEQKVLYWELFGKYERECPFVYDLLCMSKGEYYSTLSSLQFRLKEIFQNYKMYKDYEKQCIETHKAKIYKLDLHYELVDNKLVKSFNSK